MGTVLAFLLPYITVGMVVALLFVLLWAAKENQMHITQEPQTIKRRVFILFDNQTWKEEIGDVPRGDYGLDFDAFLDNHAHRYRNAIAAFDAGEPDRKGVVVTTASPGH